MATLAVIPARAGSKGIPNKNLQEINGIPLVERSIMRCLESKADMVVVSTDCDRTKEIARKWNVDVIDRPPHLATDTASSDEVVRHVLDRADHMDGITLLVQCTSPFTGFRDINGVIERIENGHDSAYTGAVFHGFLWKNPGIPINHSLGERPTRQYVEKYRTQHVETGAVYGFKTEGFLKHKYRFFGSIGVVEIPQERALEIDTQFDLELARAIFPYLMYNHHVRIERMAS